MTTKAQRQGIQEHEAFLAERKLRDPEIRERFSEMARQDWDANRLVPLRKIGKLIVDPDRDEYGARSKHGDQDLSVAVSAYALQVLRLTFPNTRVFGNEKDDIDYGITVWTQLSAFLSYNSITLTPGGGRKPDDE